MEVVHRRLDLAAEKKKNSFSNMVRSVRLREREQNANRTPLQQGLPMTRVQVPLVRLGHTPYAPASNTIYAASGCRGRQARNGMYSIKRDPLARQEPLLWLLTASGDDVGVGFGFGFFLPKNGMMPKELAVGEFGIYLFRN